MSKEVNIDTGYLDIVLSMGRDGGDVVKYIETSPDFMNVKLARAAVARLLELEGKSESGIRDKKDMPTDEQSKVYAAVPLVLHEGKWWDADGSEWSTDEHEWDGWFPK